MKICHLGYKYETFFCNVSSLFLRKLKNIIIKRVARELIESSFARVLKKGRKISAIPGVEFLYHFKQASREATLTIVVTSVCVDFLGIF